jgi:hypothetical protein
VTTVTTAASGLDRPVSSAPPRGSLIVLSGPSGVGKDAVLAPLFSAETCPPRLRRCITATTRNFKGRKGSQQAEIYLGGPLTVVAAAVAGRIENPKEVFDEL